MSDCEKLALKTMLCTVAFTCSLAQMVSSQPVEQALPIVDQVHSERKDQKEALNKREAELDEMAKQALLKAHPLAVQEFP